MDSARLKNKSTPPTRLRKAPSGHVPIVPLHGFQRKWVQDKSRFKIGLMARQTGKSFGTSLEAVWDCNDPNRRADWVFLSAGERQSKELARTAATHAKAINKAVTAVDDEWKDKDDNTYKSTEIIFPNGNRILALPANPNTARGHSANVLLDEFAFHKDSDLIWRALYPTITRGYKIRIISTPQGKKNRFYRLWTDNPKYSRHFVNIYDAVAQGLVLFNEDGSHCTPDDLREGLDDAEGWDQEYMCLFVDETTAFLTYDLIAEAEFQNEEELGKFLFGDICIGFDIARKKHLSVMTATERVGDVYWRRREKVMERMKFADQFAELTAWVEELKPRRICIDGTGIGAQMAEDAIDKFGKYRAECVVFSAPAKEDLATTILRKFEDHKMRISIDQKLRNDLHSVKKIVTSAGNVRYDADLTEKSHADRFWSLALSLHGFSGVTMQKGEIISEPKENREDADDFSGVPRASELKDFVDAA